MTTIVFTSEWKKGAIVTFSLCKGYRIACRNYHLSESAAGVHNFLCTFQCSNWCSRQQSVASENNKKSRRKNNRINKQINKQANKIKIKNINMTTYNIPCNESNAAISHRFCHKPEVRILPRAHLH